MKSLRIFSTCCALMLTLAVAGCATGGISESGLIQKEDSGIFTALDNLADFSLADLRWASADAHAKGDIIFYTCWDGLIPVVTGLQAKKRANGGTLPPFSTFPHGVASGIQVLRDMLRGSPGSESGHKVIVETVVASCGGMSQAILVDQIKLAAKVGSLMSGVGTAPAAISILKGILPILRMMPLRMNLND